MAERPTPLKSCRAHRVIGPYFAVILAFFTISGQGFAQELYAITNVKVDERAASEVEAKRIGVAKAKRAAFETLMDRLTLEGVVAQGTAPDAATAAPAGGVPVSPSGVAIAPSDPSGAARPLTVPDDERLEYLIRDIAYQDEKFGGGRYLANLTIRFHSDAINQFLQRSGVAYLGSSSPLAVILPVYKSASGDLLWSDANPWLDGWWQLDGAGTVVPYTVPLGDLSDISAIDVDRAMTVDAASINAIAARYSAGAVLIPVATQTEDGTILVEISSFGAGWPGEPELLRLNPEALLARATERAGDGGDPSTDLAQFAAAASLTLDALEDRWKSANILRFDQESTSLTTRVSVSGLQDWLDVQKALNRVAPIKAWRLAVLATDHAIVDIDYIGDQARLDQALRRVSLGLSEDSETPGSWILTRR
ncbi:MAG: hypothetical protein CMM62_06790 [Rhodospirillaceae bacterium]|nr:hypothetical protein [Rhodospirillaceae bacterium]MAX61204.1 hypothetical protein [Rhodospirillaceae bacterium]MBB55947.1 hypothetical protein [Rhodospirillaceae bacterium]|tara:strand:- start:79816 stop:81081 length:1266 start_codon:yes stop_codon:yes gene_type:complete